MENCERCDKVKNAFDKVEKKLEDNYSKYETVNADLHKAIKAELYEEIKPLFKTQKED